MGRVGMSDCEEFGHVYGFGFLEYEGGFLCRDMVGESYSDYQRFTFCPVCGRCLLGDWAKHDGEAGQ